MEGKKALKLKKIIINTPFVQEQSSVQRGDMLHTIDGPMQLIHADVADLKFIGKSAVVPKYSLVCIDMFTSKSYTYGMKNTSQLEDKLEKILSETHDLRKYLTKEGRGEITSSNQSGITQNKTKEVGKKYNVVHFNSRLNDSHAVGVEQKIRKLKNWLKNF